MCDDISASRKKIELMRTLSDNAETVNEQQQWILANVLQLTRLLTDLSCPDCGETGLSVTVCEGEQHGFSSKLTLRCDACGYAKFEMSSPRIHDSDKQNIAYEINPKIVMFSHEVGRSHAVISTPQGICRPTSSHYPTRRCQRWTCIWSWNPLILFSHCVWASI
jgi:NAD-dependent SIR2 family protein deacetylase